jgi:tRNA dimethylallyltransferase
MTTVVPIPLILVVGPTASGKSTLAAALAERCAGEVVSADAMAVYRGMDIGTAKPTAAERVRIPHHLIDVCDPSERCDAARWLALAEAAIADIHARGRLPVIAGGTPLFTKLLIEGMSAGAPRDDVVRAALDARYHAEGGEALHAELRQCDPVYAAAHHPNDRRRIVRALEVIQLTGAAYSSFHTTDGGRRDDYRVLQIGLQWDREVIYRRINARAKAMFAAGLVDEVRALQGRISPEAAQAVGYKEVMAHLAGEVDLDAAIEAVKRHSRHLAKHQFTWYKRFRDIVWIPGDAADLVTRAENLVRNHLAE